MLKNISVRVFICLSSGVYLSNFLSEAECSGIKLGIKGLLVRLTAGTVLYL